jgi:copper chaperone CopZ
MKSIKVKIEGLSPLLMNRRPMEDAEITKKKSDVYDPKEDAEKKAHFDSRMGYFVPSDMLEACFREAGKNVKNGRSSSKKLVMSSVFVSEEKVSLSRKDYDEIDKRWGTHPSTGNSVLVSRVRFNKWNLTFTITYDENRISLKKVKEIVDEAGAANGIGSYKPKHGRFKVSEFEEIIM